jgi:hypothetical protein
LDKESDKSDEMGTDIESDNLEDPSQLSRCLRRRSVETVTFNLKFTFICIVPDLV